MTSLASLPADHPTTEDAITTSAADHHGLPGPALPDNEPQAEPRAPSSDGSTAAGASTSKGADASQQPASCSGPPLQDAECRICLMQDAPNSLVAPCNCTGTVRFAHMACLVRWCKEKVSTTCEICGAQYRPEVLPFLEAEVKEQRRQQQLAAEQAARQRLASGGGGDGTDGDASAAVQSSLRRWPLLKILLVVALVTGICLVAIYFLGSKEGDAMWAAILLRVMIFLIPAYLVYRAVQACISYRSRAGGSLEEDGRAGPVV